MNQLENVVGVTKKCYDESRYLTQGLKYCSSTAPKVLSNQTEYKSVVPTELLFNKPILEKSPNMGSRRGSRRRKRRDYFNPKFVINKAFTRMQKYNNFKRQAEPDNQGPTVTSFDGKFIYVQDNFIENEMGEFILKDDIE